MTMTSPVPTSRRGAQPGRGRVATAIVALTALLAIGPPAAAATTPEVSPVAPAVVFAASPEQPVLDRTDAAAADATWRVRVSAANVSTSAAPAASVTVRVGTDALADRASMRAWLDDGTSAATFTDVADTRLPVLAAGVTNETTLSVDVAASPLAALDAGVYPLRVDSDDETVRSVLVVATQEAETSSVVIVPITAPALSEGMLTADQLAEATDAGGMLREQLDAVAGTDAVLAVDPAIAAAVRALGDAAPATATAWLDDLSALPNERFALQYGDADLAAQVGAGLTEPLAPTSLLPFVSDAARTDPTPAVDDEGETERAAPTDAELLEIDADVELDWPATGTAGSEVVAAFGGERAMLLPAAVLDDDVTATGPATTDGDRALLIYDDALAAALRDAADTTDDVARGVELATAAAYEALAGADADTTLVVVDRTASIAPRSADALRDAIDAATALPGAQTGSLDELLAETPASVAVAEVAADPARVDALRSFLSGADELEAFATILDEPQLLTGTERAETLQLLGAAWLTPAAGWDEAVAAHRAQTVATLGAVSIVEPSGITLLGSSAPLQFSVRNELAWPVNVILFADPNDPRLIVEGVTEVRAGALQTTRVDVPVEARVGSGEASIDLSLRSPSMVPIGDDVVVDVTVRAEWETVGTILMGTLVGVLVLLGVVRTVRRIRRGPSVDKAADAGDADGSDADDAADREDDADGSPAPNGRPTDG